MKCRKSATCHVRHYWRVEYRITGLEKEPYVMLVDTDTKSLCDALGSFRRRLGGETHNKPLGVPAVHYQRPVHLEAH